MGANLLLSGSSKSCGCLNRENTSKASLIRHQQNRNFYNLTGEYGIGYTSKGDEFYFDLEDYDLIKDYNWFINDQYYVLARVNIGNSKIKTIRMHRIIMNESDSNIEIDHIHGEKSRNDNRKSNLRIATHIQNSINKNVTKRNTSGVVGVNYYKRINKWRARITVNKYTIELGNYDSFDDAVKARKEAEEKYFGEWSYDNSQLINKDTLMEVV